MTTNRNSRTWIYRTASAVAHLGSDNISTVCVTGIVTAAVANKLMGDVLDWAVDHGAVGQLQDYSGCVICADDEALAAADIESISWYPPPTIPAALVVSQDALDGFGKYTMLMARHTAVRGVFLQSPEVRPWLVRQVEVLAEFRARRVIRRARGKFAG